jgi:hypothetical protein
MPTMNDNQALDMLLAMLRFKRPYGSRAEAHFVKRFILDPLKPAIDGAGNLIVRVGDRPNILWSCHTDTVHKDAGKQEIDLDPASGFVSAVNSSCLGADDGAGVWLMRQMIFAAVPGLYVFHRGEEVGGVGSKFIAKETPELLTGIDAAIALDRAGTRDVITHQMGGRCCSDTFAESLAAGLGMQYRPDDTGVFTDTAFYTDLVGECSNLSVGYERAHSSHESLDCTHLFNLRDALIRLDHSELAFERAPGEVEEEERYYMSSRYMEMWDTLSGYAPLKTDTHADLVRLVRDNPDVTADLLESFGIGASDFITHLTY